MRRNWVVRCLLVGLFPLLLIGCSMRVPLQELDFSPEEKVVLTFDDGAQVAGRMDNGERVDYRDAQHRYRGVIESVDETEIVVGELVALSDQTSHYQQERMRHFRLYVDEEDTERLILSRDRILQVERVTANTSLALRRVVFWTFGVGVALLAVRDQNF